MTQPPIKAERRPDGEIERQNLFATDVSMILILQLKTYLRLNFVTSWNFEFYLLFVVVLDRI